MLQSMISARYPKPRFQKACGLQGILSHGFKNTCFMELCVYRLLRRAKKGRIFTHICQIRLSRFLEIELLDHIGDTQQDENSV